MIARISKTVDFFSVSVFLFILVLELFFPLQANRNVTKLAMYYHVIPKILIHLFDYTSFTTTYEHEVYAVKYVTEYFVFNHDHLIVIL